MKIVHSWRNKKSSSITLFEKGQEVLCMGTLFRNQFAICLSLQALKKLVPGKLPA
jgi:hypothetical protein